MFSEEFIRKDYISENDMQICCNCTISKFSIHNNKDEILKIHSEIKNIYQQE